MDNAGQKSPDFIRMIADHMEKGYLENIIDMFKHDPGLYDILPDLIADNRLRVRIGSSALIEALNNEDRTHITRAVPLLLPLLHNADAHIRGDIAYLFGLIGTEENMRDLSPLLEDPNHDVRVIAREAIDDIRRKSGGR
jgi:HEAT repeat protein